MNKSVTGKNSLWVARNRMGFSQIRVARALGLKRTSVLSRYEHGTRVPSLANALKLEIVYRTPVAYLFDDLYVDLKHRIRSKEERIQCQEKK
jgi:transcriptional regulator with XRE-family HTH domain